jgi:hypothetical protein
VLRDIQDADAVFDAQSRLQAKRVKASYDANKTVERSFNPGDIVKVRIRRLAKDKIHTTELKLDDKWAGNYTVVKKIGEVAYQLADAREFRRTYNIIDIKLAKGGTDTGLAARFPNDPA